MTTTRPEDRLLIAIFYKWPTEYAYEAIWNWFIPGRRESTGDEEVEPAWRPWVPGWLHKLVDWTCCKLWDASLRKNRRMADRKVKTGKEPSQRWRRKS